jgi:hypothetical protein
MTLFAHIDEDCSIHVGQPDTDRLVILQDIAPDGSLVTFAARFRGGNWYHCEGASEDIAAALSRSAIWLESRLFPESAIGRIEN